MIGTRSILPALALIAATAVPAVAQVYNTPVGVANYSGTRTTAVGGGLTSGGSWAGDAQSLSWMVTPMAGTWNYSYTFTGFLQPAISHFILELSPNCDQSCVSRSGEIATYGPGDSGNPGLPASFYGIKFEDFGETSGPFVFSFTSPRMPVWGNIYFKGGNDGFTYNNGLVALGSTNINDFIARPDTFGGQTVVPEPATMALLGTGLLGLGLVGRRKRNAV